jgi:hypothetical protein
MADLIDRISGPRAEAEGRPKLPVHQFVAGLRLYAFGLVTRGQLASNWDLQGTEAGQGLQLADKIDAELTTLAKIVYIFRVESVAYLIEEAEDAIYHQDRDTVNKAKVKADLGLT